MPKNKDLKRLVRSRMQRTGESYTNARRMITKEPPRPRPAVDHGALAGMRDAVIEKRTGRTWRQWCELLDARGAAAMTHAEIAALVHEGFGVSGWWSQAVTVGYERIRGRRVVHQTAKGFAVSKSRTFAVPLARLLDAFAPKGRSEWLGDAATTARRSSKPEVVRWRETDGSFVDVQLLAKGDTKTTVSVQVGRLRSRDEVESRRALWTHRLAALDRWLVGS